MPDVVSLCVALAPADLYEGLGVDRRHLRQSLPVIGRTPIGEQYAAVVDVSRPASARLAEALALLQARVRRNVTDQRLA